MIHLGTWSLGLIDVSSQESLLVQVPQDHASISLAGCQYPAVRRDGNFQDRRRRLRGVRLAKPDQVGLEELAKIIPGKAPVLGRIAWRAECLEHPRRQHDVTGGERVVNELELRGQPISHGESLALGERELDLGTVRRALESFAHPVPPARPCR